MNEAVESCFEEGSHSGQLHEFRKLEGAIPSQVQILYPPLSPAEAFGEGGLRQVSADAVRLINAPVAQLDRVSGSEPEGRGFESRRGHCLLTLLLSLQHRW